MAHCDTCKCDTLTPAERLQMEVDATVRLVRERRESGRPDPGIREVGKLLKDSPIVGGRRLAAARRILDGDRSR